MTTARKLWIGFGTMLALLAVPALGVAVWLAVPARNLAGTYRGEGSASAATYEAIYLIVAQLVLLSISAIVGVLTARVAIRAVHKSEAALQMALAHAESVVDTVREALVILHADLRVHSANRPFYEMFRVTPQQVTGRPIYELSNHAWDIPQLREVLDRVIAENASFHEFELEQDFDAIGRRAILLNGRRLSRSDSATPLMLLSIEDVTERKRIEQERDQLLSSERAERSEAERLNVLKDEFLATVSHELRTPLQAILGWSQLLHSGRLTGAAATKAAETIETNARTQSRLVEDLLDVSRIISGKIALDMKPVPIRSIIEEAVDTIRPAANAKEIRIQRCLDAPVGSLTGDANRLRQIIWNLLSNAIKFTPKGGQVRVELGCADAHAEITVSDTGQGITPLFLPHVFERFRQADASTTKRHGGLGLGLAIVRHLVELHGGHVRVESSGEGQGASFTVALPLAAPRSDYGRKAGFTEVQPSGTTQSYSLAGIKVLVVDDDLSAREIIRRILEEAGAAVSSAASAAEALQLLKCAEWDVLVSDIGMPDMDGYELIRQIRTRNADRTGAIPAVALTALARAEDRMRALAAGYHAHAIKPVEPLEITAIVASLAQLGVGIRSAATSGVGIK